MATVTISEIAQALNMSWIAAGRKAIREKWISERYSNSSGNKRKFPVERLPIMVRLAVLKHEALQIDHRLELQPAPPAKLTRKDKEKYPDQTLMLKDWQWDVFEARIALLREFEQLKAKNGTNNAIKAMLAMIEQNLLPTPLKQFVQRANARRGGERNLSRSMILGWQRTVKKHGILGLIPRAVKKKKNQVWRPYFQEIINVSPEISIPKAQEKLKSILPVGMKRPSYHQLLRALKKDSLVEKVYRVNGSFIPIKPTSKTKDVFYVTLKIDLEKPFVSLNRLQEIISQRPEIDKDIRTSFSQAVKHIIPLLTRHTPLRLQSPLTEEEIAQLNQYKFGTHKKDSAKAKGILMIDQNATLLDIGTATNASKGKIYRWLREFNAKRVASIEVTVDCPEREEQRELRKTRVIDIIHNQPETYGINRTSWTYGTISKAYAQTYGEECSPSIIQTIVKRTGYTWRRARKVWTSPDPKYKEKISKVLDTLHDLQEGELFFFIDEAGPYQVKQYSGVSLVEKGQNSEVPEHQKSKGSIQLIAALEARTNQVVWSYIRSKGTNNIIFMLAQLCDLYPTAPRIFVTWDSISSHGSKDLLSWKDSHNSSTKEKGSGPLVEIVPLPSRSQFLNVVEAVFSGMKRAVIHNSNYGSKKEMEAAISRHFEERNLFYKNNPKRAGSKIWDRESFDLEKLPGGLYRKM